MVFENISYRIHEREKENGLRDIETFLEEINTVLDTMLQEHSINDDSDLMEVRTVEFSTNYTVQGLSRIMEYYGLNKRKLKKAEMVQTLVLFEDAPENFEIVEKRRRLWSNIEELADDPYLSRYVSF